ncbi:MAG TPA: hypothetical protein VKX28_07335 [Xanthobacteraceae bacterium]|nr:hypothetical protein [Xanthobacteraceae bacterium]
MPDPTSEPNGDRAAEKFRIDFIDPLFAVAIHIGFVEGLLQEAWWKDERLPALGAELGHLSFFLAGLVVLVASWTGYHTSIALKPIRKEPRFWLDIVLLVAYIFLLLLFRRPAALAVSMAIIFIVYCLWDFFKTLEYADLYYEPAGAAGISEYMRRCFLGWLSLRPSHEWIGGIVNIGWTAFYIVLAPISFVNWFTSPLGNGVLALIFIVTTVAYRYDKANQGWLICSVPAKLIIAVMLLFAFLLCSDAACCS